MSDLLNAASLIMIPSGYSEDKVYSAVPTDGSGDLSFTRASNGTRINSAGLVEVTPWNLVEQSETIGTSPWSNINSGITSNATTAPNGTTTAEKLMVTTANTPHQVQQGFNNDNANHTVFIYAKKSELNFIQLALGNSTEQYANFNLNTGVVGTKGSYCASSSMESVGDGWYKCIAYFNQGTIPSLMIYVTNSASSDWGGVVSYSGANNTDGIFVWGYQLNIGSTAKPYFPTTDRLNVPRLTYQNGGGGCPSLLLEKQSTNLVTYSEQFDNADWTKQSGVSVTANQTISPDGTQNADLVVGGGSSGIFQSGKTVSTTVANTKSVYLKGVSGGEVVRLQDPNQTLGYTVCTLTTSWQRFTLSEVQSGGVAGLWVTLIPSGGIYIWGAQLEASSYPTSYIPTTSASATRVGDACYKTGISSLIGQTSGVLFADFKVDNANPGARIISVSDGTFANRIVLLQDGSAIRVFVATASVGQVDISFGTWLGRHKIAVAYANNDLVVFLDGVLAATDTSISVPACSDAQVGTREDNTDATPLQGTINQAILFKTRLTNAELASLTTL